MRSERATILHVVQFAGVSIAALLHFLYKIDTIHKTNQTEDRDVHDRGMLRIRGPINR